MTDWPAFLQVGPIREWPGALRATDDRRAAPFRAPWKATLALLSTELNALAADQQELLVAIPASQFRLDGRPRASARAAHPGVILSFTTDVGRLSYPCDTYGTWQDNLRAIALALEALRKVDRYGVTKSGEQYRGFLALEAAPAAAGDSEAWLREYAAGPPWLTLDMELRAAKRKAHPDTGGSADAFQRVLDAERALREAGRL